MNLQEINRIYALIEHLLNILTALLLFLGRWSVCWFLLIDFPLLSVGSSFLLRADVTWVRRIYALARFHHLWQVDSALLVATIEASIHLWLVRGNLVWSVHVLRWRLVCNAERTLLGLCIIPSMIKSRNRLHLSWKMWMSHLSRLGTPCHHCSLSDIRW